MSLAQVDASFVGPEIRFNWLDATVRHIALHVIGLNELPNPLWGNIYMTGQTGTCTSVACFNSGYGVVASDSYDCWKRSASN